MMFSCLHWSRLLSSKMLDSEQGGESAAPVFLYRSLIIRFHRSFCAIRWKGESAPVITRPDGQSVCGETSGMGLVSGKCYCL